MNLVGFGLTVHDTSIAAYKNGKFLYRKAERQFNSKHAHAGIDWAKSVLKEWGIDKYESAVSTWLAGTDSNQFVTEKDNVTYLDHHYSHQLSASVKRENNLVLDAFAKGPSSVPGGLSPYSGLMQNIRLTELTPIYLLSAMIRSAYFDHETELRNYAEYTQGLFNDIEDSYVINKDVSKCNSWETFIRFIDLPGKIMGLQAYGKPDFKKVKEWSTRQGMRNYSVFTELMHYPKDDLNADMAATVHKVVEQIVMQKVQFCHFSDFNYSGGLAQNVVINRAMLDAGKIPHIDPWAYDGGCSIGALNYLLDKHDIERPFNWEQDDEAPLGEPDAAIYKQVAELLAQNKVVGWYQGNGEVGPRALGNRSILFNPTHKDNKDKINKIKNREWWRPFGASVKEDQADKFFDLPVSRHMLFNSNVKYSGIPAVTHVDGTCRHQTVPETNHQYYWMLDAFEQETGLPVLGNTSLNKQGKPICSTVEEALDIFKTSELDAICIGDTLYEN